MNTMTKSPINRAETTNYSELLLPAHAMWFLRAKSLDIYFTTETGERFSEQDFASLSYSDQQYYISHIQKTVQATLESPTHQQTRRSMLLTDIELLNFTNYLKLYLSDIADEEQGSRFIEYLEKNIINATTIYQHQDKIQVILHLIETHTDLKQYSRSSKEMFIKSVKYLKQLEQFIPAPVIQPNPCPDPFDSDMHDRTVIDSKPPVNMEGLQDETLIIDTREKQRSLIARLLKKLNIFNTLIK